MKTNISSMSYSEKDVLAKVGDLLVEINEEYATVQEHEGQLVAIELGLLTAKAKYLVAHLDLLTQLASKADASTIASEESSSVITFTPASPKADEKEDEQDTQDEIPAEEPKEDSVVNAEPEPKEETPVEEEPAEEEPAVEEPEEEQEPEEVVQSSASDHKEIPAVEPKKTSEDDLSISAWRNAAQEDKVEQKVQQEEAVVKSVVEESRTVEVTQPQAQAQATETQTSTGRPLTLNEMIQQQRRAGLTNANQFKTPASKTEQIVDLKTAVSLNDKLLFIKDLFNGYSLAYTEAIELLNRFDNMAEADAFLQANYALKNNWTSKPQTVEKLYHILQKKFA